MGTKKVNQFKDFVPTISDSEEDIPDLDASDDEYETAGKVKSRKKTKKGRKGGAVIADDEDAHADLNPEFHFNDEGAEGTTDFSGWDFVGDGERAEQKDVDLDGIIRRKGGLVQLAGVEESEEEVEEAESAAGASDDEELALDGFGMGAVAQREAAGAADESDSESDKDSDNSAEEAVELDGVEFGDEQEEAREEDTAEEMAQFYAPSNEGEEAKNVVHSTFNSLSLSRPVLKGLAALGYTKPSPIQGATIPIALLGKDVIAGAVTGSGKTAAFMIPIIERLLYKPAKIASTRVLVLTPTRELAIQVADVGKKLGKFVSGLTFGLAVGGLNLRQQEQALKLRPDIVIATPGRIIDHIRNSASFSVDSVEVLVIDEADRMLEDGFQDELNEIMSLIPSKRQTLLFSATMNSRIKQLISLSLKKPVRIMIDPPKQAANKLTQEFVRLRKREHLKPALLYHLLRKLDSTGQKRIVVFVARKEVAHRLRVILGLLGMKAGELHGSLTQEQRLQSVNNFKSLDVPVLVCTDLASRGLDIPKIEVVINYDMPKTYEIYLHRVGRTARAGREGKSVTLVGESTQERSIVKDAIKSVDGSKGSGRACGRVVDWKQVEEIHKLVQAKEDVIGEILEEEKQEKEILRAEMEIRKGENMLKFKEEINARPRRTWFQSESEKKNSSILQALSKNKKVTNSKKRKREEAQQEVGSRQYKKTQKDRTTNQELAFRKQKKGGNKKKKVRK
ncbi:AAL164Cp [Eremothecium gossypii ATCC 10895]|uniref:ATP-dependent RNA helicase DRS1 n=1 Tax=Eremothecium gossypii (strain ATCC 10895 / CBS 109.51 / FGSC 9923 / NRRL Y-1056) TaxID=284811 RepID=DRS1_EREGS|nr:AAL164Cp [Eremothecium gossypii ATCC 10895]Q75F95.1 RecName: Full=ATP-dependent RNA helicase DRS1 [Eremothecium gossypii ATCC 10895]AAS50202.1 AAL164Cp [Eremothecium gossypii ATCC 10895]AEY94487.1 FAAL164Cp [Eremothecium gossypii FDAG1]